MKSKSTKLTNSRLLVTGGAGFIGSNLIEHFLNRGNDIICLDNLSTGNRKNIEPFESQDNFRFINGDIRDLDVCQEASEGCDYIFHQAALGSVPRSVKDPHTTNAVNIDGTLNMLLAARDQKVKRFIFAASSSTYGDSKELPKTEEKIGNPLSPYAITKYVNELYAKIFSDLYGMQCLGLRYFNVFGKRQDPNGAYAAVIPLWVKQLIRHEQPVINGDGSYSRDFTYIDNVVQANELAALAPLKTPSEVFNIAYGGNTTLKELFIALRNNLAQHDPAIAGIEAINGPFREGDIPHSMASIKKAEKILGYQPEFDAAAGFREACEWYFENLK